MKKRILFALMAVVMVVALVACGTQNTEKPDENKVVVESSADLINKVWEKIPADQKFAAMGGDFENIVNDAAGIFSMADAEALSSTLHVSADGIALVDEVGSLVHAMNANTLTSAAFHLKDASTSDAFITSLKESVKNTQWMCGFPETLVVYTVNGEYVFYVLGNGEIVSNFKTQVTEVYGESAVLVSEEAIA